MSSISTEERVSNFVRHIIDSDLKTEKLKPNHLRTRFPPEPNGYLHIGHAKSICLNFGLANEYNGHCHLRFDDTNPEKENQEYVDSIEDVLCWLGFDWGTDRYFASDYFESLYQYAEWFIEQDLAYVDSQTAEQIRAGRGTLTEAGSFSPFRARTVTDNLTLFREMRAGRYVNGEHVLRLKIDMASPNINLRDPVIYRIRHVPHHKTGTAWCLYPLYDYTHCISDALEGITHSVCTLEFEDHRPLYNWILERLAAAGRLALPLPQQIEFARLNLTYTLTSKRKLLQLVTEGFVSGWDDPRMSTLVGFRRRGYTPEALRDFCERIGVTKADSWVDLSYLEACLREQLNEVALRGVAVLRPLKVIITNYPENTEEICFAPNHPLKADLGQREIIWSRELWIEQDDFMEDPSKGFHRLSPGKEVRFRYGFLVRCESVIKDVAGRVVEVHCVYDPDTRSGTPGSDVRKVKGAIHWLSVRHAQSAEVRLYDRLFNEAHPDSDDFKLHINANSKEVLLEAKIEPHLCHVPAESSFQFERLGYFVADRYDHQQGTRAVFNRSVGLRDTFNSK